MKCLLYSYDRLKIDNNGTIIIDPISKDRGIESYRWDGNKLIDLLVLSSIWVEYIDGGFRLHSIDVPHSQLVEMEYKDRKKLWNDSGVYKIKSDEQIKTERNLELRVGNYPTVSDQIGALIKYMATKDDLPDELQAVVDKVDLVKIEYPKMIEVVK